MAPELTAEEHKPLCYRMGSLINLTCTCGELAVSYVGTPPTEDEMAAKHAEHVVEAEEDPSCWDCGDTEAKLCPYGWECQSCATEPCGDNCEWTGLVGLGGDSDATT